jgi:hypothetical protein
MAKAGYGSSEFFNKVVSILKGKYDTEIATLQADSVTLQHIKLQSLIMLEVLEELRKINVLIINPEILNKPQEIVNTPKPIVPVSTSSASSNAKG